MLRKWEEILKKGFIPIPLERVVEMYCRSHIDVFSIIDDAYCLYVPSGLDKLLENMRSVVRAFGELKRDCINGIKYASSVLELAKKGGISRISEINERARKMQHIRDEICQMEIIQPFLEMAGQRALFNFRKAFIQLKKRQVNISFMVDLSQIFIKFFSELSSIADSLAGLFNLAVTELEQEVCPHEFR